MAQFAGPGADWRPGWLERARGLRDRLLMSPGFQRWAAAFPVTRWIATRRERELFDLCAGFVYTQTLLACVRLQVFQVLADGPLTAAMVGTRVDLSPVMAERLLLAATALRLLERRGADRFGLGPLGAAILGNPSVAAMIEHHSMLYEDLRDPVALLRAGTGTGALHDYWAYARADQPAQLDAGRVADYSALMAASQTMVAEDVVAAWHFGRYRTILDVGGGEGVFLSAVGAAAPRAQLVLFDLPPVARRGGERLNAAGFAGRARAVGGDFCLDPLPTGADLITLVRVLHDHDDDLVLRLLRAVRQAMSAGSTLLVAEPMAGTAGAERIGDAYFGFYLLAMGSGRARTPTELTRLLEMSGFTDIRLPPTRRPLRVRLLTARPA
jgi:demethylspheroidene O-methyltransferase